MKKQMIWGLAILMLLIGIAGVFLLIPQDTDTESEMVLGEATKKLLEDRQKQHNDPALTDANRPPPPGETKEMGYWHEGHWHKNDSPDNKGTPDTTHRMDDTLPEFVPMPELIGQPRSPEEIEAYRKEWGVDPPLIGANWEHMRNDNGEVIKHYDNSTTTFYKVVNDGFAPTPEQWEQHEILQRKLVEARRSGDTAEYDRILAELKVLIAKSRGPAPVITGTLYSGDPISEEEAHRQREEAIREVYRKFGLEHRLKRLYQSDIIPEVVE